MEHGTQRPQRSAPSPIMQVCDRCRWKKIKCDGARPCSNCRNANFPCDTRARLSKQSTPRSYVQYLEARVRQLEGQRETAWSPQASSSRLSPYGEAHLRGMPSTTSSDDHPKKQSLPDWTVLRELGTQVIDEDGFARYMGPSSGVGFSAQVLQHILDDDQPQDPDFYCLFSLDDFSRNRALEAADELLWQISPTNLPSRAVADKIIGDFFLFTERVFPALHRPTFIRVVDELYNLGTIGTEWFELLAQFYFALSVGYCFDPRLSIDQRARNQIWALQNGCRCYFTTLHKRRDGLTRLQTLTLHAYALVLLRQRSEALRMSAVANTKALEVGLHHDGKQFTGNPLDTEMRRRVFWCVFMLHLFNCSIEGLPRALHEADITIIEPNDIDDDQLTTTEVLSTVPGRTKIRRFVTVCRLSRILSRTLDVLYSHNKRKQASTRIEQMNRLCCEHLLDQLDFSFDETPDDIPPADTDDPAELAILASYANEQILYHYIRWLIHRPGLALSHQDPHFASCLQICTEASAAILKTTSVYRRAMPFIMANPSVHPWTIFVSALTPLYRTSTLKSMPATIPMSGYSVNADLEACQNALSLLEHGTRDHSDLVRQRVFRDLMVRVFGEDHEEGRRMDRIISQNNPLESRSASGTTSGVQSSGGIGVGTPAVGYHEQQLEHLTAHEELRNFVHDAFSPNMDLLFPGSDLETHGSFDL